MKPIKLTFLLLLLLLSPLTDYLRLQVRLDDHRVPVILPQVPHQVALLHERLVALRTGKRLLATMRPPMRDQVALADEILRTEVAAERSIGRRSLVVAAHVEQQVALQRERFAALFAGERTLAAMRPTDVIDEVLLVVERLVADVARVRRLARVLSQVIRQVLLARERLLAELATVR